MKNKIIGTILTILLFVSITTIQAQDKCKFIKQGKDPITGLSFKVVGGALYSGVPFISDDIWILNIEHRGDKYFLSSLCENLGIFEDKMVIGDSLILKLDNDKVITFHATKVKEPLHHSVSNQNYVQFYSEYAMKIEEVELLSTAKVVYARINFSSKTRTEKVKDKNAIVIQKGAICILK